MIVKFQLLHYTRVHMNKLVTFTPKRQVSIKKLKSKFYLTPY